MLLHGAISFCPGLNNSSCIPVKSTSGLIGGNVQPVRERTASKQHEIYMPYRGCVGTARAFRYQHVGIGHAKVPSSPPDAKTQREGVCVPVD